MNDELEQTQLSRSELRKARTEQKTSKSSDPLYSVVKLLFFGYWIVFGVYWLFTRYF